MSVCAANPAKGPKPSIGKPPHITPGFGSYMVGGAGGGFPGLAADNVPCEYTKNHCNTTYTCKYFETSPFFAQTVPPTNAVHEEKNKHFIVTSNVAVCVVFVWSVALSFVIDQLNNDFNQSIINKLHF